MPSTKKLRAPSPPSPYSHFDPARWPAKWEPDVRATIVTKFGENVHWESMGLEARTQQIRHGRTVQLQPRFPRAFLCVLTNNGTIAESAFYDLYDVGAQRRYDEVEVEISGCMSFRFEVSPDQPAAPLPTVLTSSPSGAVIVKLLPGGYEPGGPKVPALLRFDGPTCTLRIIREAVAKTAGKTGKNRLLGDEEGAPPPPDPGDDGNQLPMIGTP